MGLVVFGFQRVWSREGPCRPGSEGAPPCRPVQLQGPLRRAGGWAEGATEGGPAWKGQGLQGRAGAPQLGLGTPWRPSSTGGSPPGGQRPGTLAAPAGSDGRRGAEPRLAGCHARMFLLLRDPGCSSSPIPASQLGRSPQGGVQSQPWAGSRAQAGEGGCSGLPQGYSCTRACHLLPAAHPCLALGHRAATPLSATPGHPLRCEGRSGATVQGFAGEAMAPEWPHQEVWPPLRDQVQCVWFRPCRRTFGESRGQVFCRLHEESGSRSSSRPWNLLLTGCTVPAGRASGPSRAGPWGARCSSRPCAHIPWAWQEFAEKRLLIRASKAFPVCRKIWWVRLLPMGAGGAGLLCFHGHRVEVVASASASNPAEGAWE